MSRTCGSDAGERKRAVETAVLSVRGSAPEDGGEAAQARGNGTAEVGAGKRGRRQERIRAGESGTKAGIVRRCVREAMRNGVGCLRVLQDRVDGEGRSASRKRAMATRRTLVAAIRPAARGWHGHVALPNHELKRIGHVDTRSPYCQAVPATAFPPAVLLIRNMPDDVVSTDRKSLLRTRIYSAACFFSVHRTATSHS